MGKSVFHAYDKRYAYHYYNRLYQIADSTYVLHHNGEEMIALYNHHRDSLMQKNLLHQGEDAPQDMLNYLKAVIQFYNEAMNNNGFVYP